MKNTISFNTKFGWVSATEINQKITRIQFNKTSKSGRFSKNLKNLKKMLNNYFKGKTNKINAPISLKGNNNQKKIWRELKKIQRGSTNTYGKIARKLKFSPRYVGKVCGENKHVILIPCHRVIRSDGSMGGFSAKGGVKLKKKLIQLEKY
tara:strand:- start:4227 stop:4676 length:450 start_codon:yes stop_codon:yes gene_type:complete